MILLNDTGVGTAVAKDDGSGDTWTLRSVLADTINPGEKIPYLILLSHCHWDHILGLRHWDLSPSLSASPPTIAASAHDKFFLTPYAALNHNSLCPDNGFVAPTYTPALWPDHQTSVTYPHPAGLALDLGVRVLHTPGHTPDSLSWYDAAERTLYVGDHLYQRESGDTRAAPWGPERACPIVFPAEADLGRWWRSNRMLGAFVAGENARGTRVKLAAGHVTAEADAAGVIAGAERFVAAVLRGEVPCESMFFCMRGREMWHWTWKVRKGGEGVEAGEFSLGAPMEVVEEGRRAIERGQWDGE